jgi:hypothetical protein
MNLISLHEDMTWGTFRRKIAAFLAGGVLSLAALHADDDRVVAEEPSTSITADPESWTVTLPSGIEVELIGTSQNFSKNRPWWRPDGSPLEFRPYRNIRVGTPLMATDVGRELAVRLYHLPAEPVGFTFGSDHAEGWSSGPLLEPGKHDSEMYAVAIATPAADKEMTFRCGVASGRWNTVVTTSPGGNADLNIDDQKISVSAKVEKNGKHSIDVVHNVSDAIVRVIAVERDGTEHLESSSEFRSREGAEEFTASFQLGAKDIESFCLQTKPYEWAEFKEVILPPIAEEALAAQEPVAATKRASGGTPADFTLGVWNKTLLQYVRTNRPGEFGLIELGQQDDPRVNPSKLGLPVDAPIEQIVAKTEHGDLYVPQPDVIEPIRGTVMAPLQLSGAVESWREGDRSLMRELFADAACEQITEEIMAYAKSHPETKQHRLRHFEYFGILCPDGRVFVLGAYGQPAKVWVQIMAIGQVKVANAASSTAEPVDDNKPPVSELDAPTGASAPSIQASIMLDRKEFLLGESIAVDFEMINKGKEPASYGGGSFYPTLRIAEAFRISAVMVDENGKAVGEPVVNWPMPQDFGGPMSNWKLEPGETNSTTLFVTRYVRFREPGRYRLKIENVDKFNNKTVHAIGETFVTLKQPTAEQARSVYQRMKQAPRKAWDDGRSRFLGDAADFETMHQPIYLLVLKEFAEQGDLDALPSLERMESLEANEMLVSVIARTLDRDDWQMARICYQSLKQSLPFPNWFDEINGDSNKADRERVARTWKAEFNPVLTRLARRLTQEVTSPDDKNRVPRSMVEAQGLLVDIDYIYRCIGGPEDFGDCLKAYEMSIELTKTLPFETHQYFRPRGSAFGLGHTVVRMMRRGAKPPIPPTHRGEAAAFVIALRTQDGFRPPGWEDEIIRWARNDTPYLSELILQYTRSPVPERLLDMLPEMLGDQYVDLAIAACHIAKMNPRKTFREPIQQILEKGREKHLLNAAAAAGPPNGVTNDKIMEIWLSRMDNQDLGGEAVLRLLLTILEDNQNRSEKELSPQVATDTKARWQRFITEHRDKLSAGHQFKISDPEITPDLFPPGFQFYRDRIPWPPENSDPAFSPRPATD